MTDFIFWGSKITADGDCSHETKRCLFLGTKAMTNLDSVLKKQIHHFANKNLSSQRCRFSSSHVWMWQLEHREVLVLKNWCFELWYWRRLLRIPLIAKRSIQSILKEINSEYSLESLMLNLNLHYSGDLLEEPTHWKVPWCWESLRTGREDYKGWNVWMVSLTQWAWVWGIPERWWSTGKPDILQCIGSQSVRHDWVTEKQQRKFSMQEVTKEGKNFHKINPN